MASRWSGWWPVVLALAACAPRGAVAPPPRERPAREIRILTLNMWSGLTYRGVLETGRHRDDPEARHRLLVTEMRALRPDVVVLQEVNPLPGEARRIARALGYDAAWNVVNGGVRIGPVGLPVNLREGLAVLVHPAWALEDLGDERLGGAGLSTNGLCAHLDEITKAWHVRVVVEGVPLNVYAVHLHAGPWRVPGLARRLRESPPEVRRAVRADLARRRQELERLRAFVRRTRPAGEAAVIVGDFNAPPESGELDPLLVGLGWRDTYRVARPSRAGYTWDPAGNPNFRELPADGAYEELARRLDRVPARIDLILTDLPSRRILDSRVVFRPRGGLAASDHHGVMTTLGW